MKKISSLLIISLLILGSCGKKGPLTYPGEQKRQKFDKISDENE
jgi:predicted small lipoprotein YifL